MKFLALGLAWVSCLVSIAGAQTADSTAILDLSIEVPVWVDELDAPEAMRRRQAEKHLRDAGPEAEAFVPPITDHLSVGARDRLNLVRQFWRTARAKTDVTVTVIRLDGATTLAAALEEISSASGIEFEHSANGQLPISTPNIPLVFWHAVDLVLDQANLDINFYGGDRGRLMLIPREPDRPSRVDSAAYSGMYRIEPTVVTTRRVLGRPTLSGLNVTMTLSWQPDMPPIGLSLPIAELSGQLEDGTRLVPQSSGDTIDVSTPGEIAQCEFFVPMLLPDSRSKKINSLSGVITAMLPGKRRAFKLSLTEPAASSSHEAMTVSIESIRTNGPLHEVRVSIKLDNAKRSLESHRQWIFENEVHVLLDGGTHIDHLGYQVYRQSADGIGVGYLFDLGGDTPPVKSKLIYESPTSVVSDRTTFMLQGIPLP